MPDWLRARVPASTAELVGESDSRQVFSRLAGCWTYWGWKYRYFDAEYDARAFYDELCYMLAMQMAAPNSPQWFNTGLHWAYNITARHKVITLSILAPANSPAPPVLMSIRLRMPASSNRCLTIW